MASKVQILDRRCSEILPELVVAIIGTHSPPLVNKKYAYICRVRRWILFIDLTYKAINIQNKGKYSMIFLIAGSNQPTNTGTYL